MLTDLPAVAYYEVRPGWQRPVVRFERTDEFRLAAYWNRIWRNAFARVWLIDVDGRRWGTKEGGEFYTGDPPGRYLSHCIDCEKEFWWPSATEPLCPGCAIAVRPCDYFD